MKRLADQVTSLRWHVVVQFAKDHDQFALDVFGALDAVVVLAGAQRAAVDVGSEVADGGRDAWVQGAAVGEMAAETHAWKHVSIT